MFSSAWRNCLSTLWGRYAQALLKLNSGFFAAFAVKALIFACIVQKPLTAKAAKKIRKERKGAATRKLFQRFKL